MPLPNFSFRWQQTTRSKETVSKLSSRKSSFNGIIKIRIQLSTAFGGCGCIKLVVGDVSHTLLLINNADVNIF